MARIAQRWRLWRTREARYVVRSRWLWRVGPERRARAERALLEEPGVAVDLVRILGCDEDLGEHFVLGFTARPEPASPNKRISDGFAAMALRCGQLRMEELSRRLLRLERSARSLALGAAQAADDGSE